MAEIYGITVAEFRHMHQMAHASIEAAHLQVWPKKHTTVEAAPLRVWLRMQALVAVDLLRELAVVVIADGLKARLPMSECATRPMITRGTIKASPLCPEGL